MNHLIQDLRYGFRMLAKAPGFTTVAVLVLAIAIGGTTAMFSIVNAVALRPLPVPEPNQLVRLYGKENKPGGIYRSFSYDDLVHYRDQNTVFSDLMGFALAMVGVNEGDMTRRCFAAVVSANYFDAFRVRVAQGRGFRPEEEKPGSAIPVAVLSHPYWQRTGADPNIIGKTVRLNARSVEVVGVAPEHFTGTTAMFCPDFWLPLGMYELVANDFMNERKQPLSDRNLHSLMLVGRLKPGVTMEAAQAQLQPVAQQLAEAFPDVNKDFTVELGQLQRLSMNTYPNNDDGLSVLSVLLMAMSGSVLLIACLNLANMLLARGATRRREMAVRLALGGGRMRLIQQLMTENFLLALLGGVGGLLVASWAGNLLMASLSTRLTFITLTFDGRHDWRVLLATFAVCTLSVLLFGLGPAWRLSRVNVTTELKEQVGDELQGRRKGMLVSPRSLLVVGQLGLSMALLIAAGIFAKSALTAAKMTPGFSFDERILVEMDSALAGYNEQRGAQVFREILETVRGLPGVKAATLAYVVPFGLFSDGQTVHTVGGNGASSTNGAPDPGVYASFNIVAGDYFRTLGLPMLRGREFDAIETSGVESARVVIIDQPLAEKLFPGEDPIGRSIRFAEKDPVLMQIVGVATGVRDELGQKELRPHAYVPLGQRFRSGMNLHVNVSGSGPDAENGMVPTIQEAIRAVDPRMAIISAKTFREFHDDGLQLWFVRMAAKLCGAFGLLALFLAVIGVYGVNSYVVSRRTREIGVRMALGASARNVLWMILKQGLKLTGAGVLTGVVLGVIVSLLLRSLVFGVSSIEPLAFTVGPVCLAIAALIASYLPALRATRVDPMAALRCE